MKKFLLLLMPLVAAAQHPASEVLGMKIYAVNLKDNLATVVYKLDIDGSKVKPTERWEVTPTLGGVNLPMIVVNGRQKTNMVERGQRLGDKSDHSEEFNVRRSDHISLKRTATVPWQSAMNGAPVVLKTRVLTCCNERSLEEALPMAAPAALATIVVAAPREARETVGKHSESHVAHIIYPVGRAEVDRARGNNDQELHDMRAVLNRISQNPHMTLDGIALTGYASPDGAWADNDRLAAARVDALRTYIADNFGVSIDKITVNHVAEDWKGLRQAVSESNMWRMNSVLKLIDTNPDADTREQQLRALDNGMAWQYIMHNIMPSLRRTKYEVNYTVNE